MGERTREESSNSSKFGEGNLRVIVDERISMMLLKNLRTVSILDFDTRGF